MVLRVLMFNAWLGKNDQMFYLSVDALFDISQGTEFLEKDTNDPKSFLQKVRQLCESPISKISILYSIRLSLVQCLPTF